LNINLLITSRSRYNDHSNVIHVAIPFHFTFLRNFYRIYGVKKREDSSLPLYSSNIMRVEKVKCLTEEFRALFQTELDISAEKRLIVFCGTSL